MGVYFSNGGWQQFQQEAQRTHRKKGEETGDGKIESVKRAGDTTVDNKEKCNFPIFLSLLSPPPSWTTWRRREKYKGTRMHTYSNLKSRQFVTFGMLNNILDFKSLERVQTEREAKERMNKE